MRSRRRIVRGALVGAILALMAVATESASAQTTYNVTVQNDDGSPNTLSWAIGQATTAGDVINLQTDVTLNASSPQIVTSITIQSDVGGPYEINGGGLYQILTVSAGTVTIRDLVLSDGLARGGDGQTGNGGGGGGLGAGGALYVGTGDGLGTNAQVTLENVLFQNNEAQGGTGGTGNGTSVNGGDGGSYNGNAAGNGSAAGTGGGTGTNLSGPPLNPPSANSAGYGGGGAGSGEDGTTGGEGNGGGSGGAPGDGGDGGGALGGAVFVSNGSSLTIRGTTGIASNNVVTGGTGGATTAPGGSAGSAGFANGGGLYVGIGSDANFDTTLNDITITGNVYANGNITIDGNPAGQVTFQGSTIVARGSNFVGSVTLSTGTLNIDTTQTSVFNGSIGGAGGLNLAGTGTTFLSSTNSYTGGTTVGAGHTLQGNTLGLEGAITNSGTVRFLNMFLNNDANGTPLAGTNFDGNFSGVINGDGDVIITGSNATTGSGIVTFLNAQGYTGATTVAGGRLRGTVETLPGDIANNGQVIFNQDVAATTTDTYTGVISGSGGVLTAGSTLIIFSTAQTYIGTTTVGNTGGLQVAGDTLQGNIRTNTVVTFTQAGDATYAGNISGTGRVDVNVTGTLALTGNNTYTGGTTVTAGTLEGDTDSVQGNITNSANVVFNQNFDGTYAGVMNGSGGVRLIDSGRVVFSGTNTYTGNTTVDAGTLEGTTFSLQGNIDNGAEVDFNQNFSGTFNGVIDGAGSVVKSGTGNVSLVGTHTYAGDTTITGGKLSVNGTINSPVFVDTAGALGGNGTINGDVNNQGTVAPGNSIGTLFVNGTYTSGANSVQEIEINTAGTTPGVHSDLIDVTGNVQLDGGTVSVITNTFVGVTAGSRYVFMQYTGTRNGEFDGATINTPFLTPTLDYMTAGEIAFLLFRSQTSYEDVAATPNQSQIAMYLDQNSTSASGDFADVLDQVNLLTASQARSALDQMTGAVYGTAARANMFNTLYMFMQIQRNTGYEGLFGTPRAPDGQPIADGETADPGVDVVLVGYSADSTLPVYRFVPHRRPVWNAWTTAYGTGQTGSETLGGYSGAGTITSLYRYLSDIAKFGVFGAYNFIDVQTEVPFQSNRTYDGQTGSYLRLDDGETHFLVAHSVGLDSHESRRQIQFGAINREARGEYDGWQTTTYAELGHVIYYSPVDIEPFVGLQYTYLRQNGFTETGADALNLDVGGIDTDAFYSLLGARVSQDWQGGRAELRGVWLHNYMGDTSVLNSTFAAVGGAPFATQGASFGHDAALLGCGVNWNVTERLNLAANYDAFINNDAVFHVGSGTAQIRW